jgi:hypothetical protein
MIPFATPGSTVSEREVGECDRTARAELPVESGSPSYADDSQKKVTDAIVWSLAGALVTLIFMTLVGCKEREKLTEIPLPRCPEGYIRESVTVCVPFKLELPSVNREQ